MWFYAISDISLEEVSFELSLRDREDFWKLR